MEKFKNIFFNRVQPFSTTNFNPRRDGSLIKFREFFKCEVFFEFCGYPFLRNIEKSKDKFLKIHSAATQVVGILVALLSVVSCIIFAQEGNLEATIENICYVATYVSTTMRFLYILFYHRRSILDIIEKLDENFPHHGLDQHFYGVRKYLKELNLISWLAKIFYPLAMIQFTIFIVEIKIYGWWTSQPTQWLHMHPFWFPFDASNPLFYWPIHIIEIWSLAMTVLLLLFWDILYACLMTLTAMEFDILARKISEAESVEELKKLIDIHQQLIEVTEKLEEIFSPLLLANITTTISIMCVAAFLANTGASVLILLKYTPAVFEISIHGFIQCYFAQKLSDSSELVGYAAYDSPWLESDLKFRKLILIIMIKASKPQQMTAWHFFKMSMETYYWILQTSHSYYSVLMGRHSSNMN